MTYNYEATLWTCWGEFSKDLVNCSEENFLECRKIFFNFYNFLVELFEGGAYYKTPSKAIIEVWKHNYQMAGVFEYLIWDDTTINLEYLKIKTKRADKIIGSRRASILKHYLTNELDFTKILRSLRANIIHGLDGTVARAMIKKMINPRISIHDSFSSDILH
jgi:hypothetical protein